MRDVRTLRRQLAPFRMVPRRGVTHVFPAYRGSAGACGVESSKRCYEVFAWRSSDSVDRVLWDQDLYPHPPDFFGGFGTELTSVIKEI